MYKSNEVDYSSYQAMDEIYEEAGNIYLTNIIEEIKCDLQLVYLIRDTRHYIKKLIDNSFFESEKYLEGYTIEDFILKVDILMNSLFENNEIENIESVGKDLIKEYFNC